MGSVTMLPLRAQKDNTHRRHGRLGMSLGLGVGERGVAMGVCRCCGQEQRWTVDEDGVAMLVPCACGGVPQRRPPMPPNSARAIGHRPDAMAHCPRCDCLVRVSEQVYHDAWCGVPREARVAAAAPVTGYQALQVTTAPPPAPPPPAARVSAPPPGPTSLPPQTATSVAPVVGKRDQMPGPPPGSSKLVTCSLCGASVGQRNLQRHEQERCPQRKIAALPPQPPVPATPTRIVAPLVRCPFCHQSFTPIAIASHIEPCPHRRGRPTPPLKELVYWAPNKQSPPGAPPTRVERPPAPATAHPQRPRGGRAGRAPTGNRVGGGPIGAGSRFVRLDEGAGDASRAYAQPYRECDHCGRPLRRVISDDWMPEWAPCTCAGKPMISEQRPAPDALPAQE